MFLASRAQVLKQAGSNKVPHVHGSAFVVSSLFQFRMQDLTKSASDVRASQASSLIKWVSSVCG